MLKFTMLTRTIRKPIKRDRIVGQLVIAVCLLVCVLMLRDYKKWNSCSSEQDEVELLRNQNENLKRIVKHLQMKTPHPKYEQHRKRIAHTTKYFWFYLKYHLDLLSDSVRPTDSVEFSGRIKDIKSSLYDFKTTVLADLDEVVKYDGYGKWRENEAKSLGLLVETRLRHLENPENCSAVKKAVCGLNLDNCAFGCQIHHAAECLSLAYGLKRLLIFNTTGFVYDPEGLGKVYHPLSESCTQLDAGEVEDSWAENSDAKVLRFLSTNEFNRVTPRSKYLPGAMPADMLGRLSVLHGYPLAWWMGQLKKFIMRPVPSVAKGIEEVIKKLGIYSPIVGVQIRRTDKKVEAQFFAVEEYMLHVEEYFDRLERYNKIKKRRIFLASDDQNVIDEVKQKYPRYEILLNKKSIRDGGDMRTRYTHQSLLDIITDIEILSRCDYLVATFSSNVGRLAYELMQTRHPDASENAVSLERHYYTVYQHLGVAKAIIPHHPANQSEVQLEMGDTSIMYFHYNFNGLMLGRNNRTNHYAHIPAFKIEFIPESVDFPLYPVDSAIETK